MAGVGTGVQAKRYVRNPDVVVREEDAEGALLFNPDTNQIKVLNGTGLFIWKQCNGTLDLVGLVSAVQGAFEEVPVDQVAADVQAFVDGLVQSGFLGLAEEPGR